MSKSAPFYNIAIVAYPGVQMSAVLGLGDLFTIANRASAKDDGPQLRVFEIYKKAMGEQDFDFFDAVILPPNLSNARGEDDTVIHDWLRLQHATGAIVCSVCAGAFWLGHSGLLDGRPVTTHWALENEFKTAFPTASLNAEHILIDDHDIVTAGGVMAWLDLGLHIVNRWQGPQMVTETARHLLIDPSGREQKNYRSFRPPLTHGDAVILTLQHWLEANSNETISVKGMAKRSSMSDRTFLRRFKAATGYTPHAYVQNLRMEKARGLLERVRIPVSDVSWTVGYQDPSAFSRVFKATTGLSASEYRTRFGLSREHQNKTIINT